jgi:hypothetical protein
MLEFSVTKNYRPGNEDENQQADIRKPRVFGDASSSFTFCRAKRARLFATVLSPACRVAQYAPGASASHNQLYHRDPAQSMASVRDVQVAFGGRGGGFHTNVDWTGLRLRYHRCVY